MKRFDLKNLASISILILIAVFSFASLVRAWTNPTQNPPLGGGALNFYNNNVGIGTTNPTEKLYVSGNIYATDNITGGGSMTGNVPAAQVSAGIFGSTAGKGYYTFQAALTTNPVLFVDATNERVGIGTTGPGNKLSISGSIDADASGIELINTATPGRTWWVTSGVKNVDATTFGIKDQTGGSYPFVIKTNGNVGIGTTGPGSQLTVTGSSGTGAPVIGRGTLFLTDNSATVDAGGAIVFGAAADGLPNTYFAGIRGLINNGINNTTGNLAFYTRNLTTDSNLTERLRITTAGNVGIGTTGPGAKLHISGLMSTGDETGIRLTNTEATAGRTYRLQSGISGVNHGYFSIFDVTAVASRLAIDNTGNVGIGTTGPRTQLQIHGNAQNTSAITDTGSTGGTLYLTDNDGGMGAGGTILFGTETGSTYRFAAIKGLVTNGVNNGYGDLAFSTRNNPADTALTERLIIKGDGNVGIGTTTPNYKLDVNGGTGTALRIAGGGDLQIDAQTSGSAAVLYNDIGKLVSTVNFDAPQLCIAGACQSSWPSSPIASVFGRTGVVVATTGDYTATMVGLGNVTNESKATMFTSPTFTGSVTMPGTGIWNSSGNVGIGITDPTEKLYVSGNIYATGNITAGGSTTGNVNASQVSAGVFGSIAGKGNYAFQAAGNANPVLFVDATNERVGIGTTGPRTQLQIHGNAQNTSAITDAGSTGGTLYLTDNDGGVGAGGTILFGTETGSTYRFAAIKGLFTNGVNGYGDLAFSTRNNPADTALTERLIIKGDGNVGIGTTAPGSYKLNVSGDANITGNLNITGNISGGTTVTYSSDVNMNNYNITGINKITATTIDPVYEINGKKYATYVASVAGGVKEEYSGKALLSRKSEIQSTKSETNSNIQNSNDQNTYEYIIDFTQIEEGSDLWLWYNIIDFSKDNIEVLITPYGAAADIYYLIDGHRIIFRGDQPVEFSYRLTGKRSDWKDWPTAIKD